MLQLDLLEGPYWRKVAHDDARARALADRHYSRQTPGALDFTPPGRKLVLLGADELALWAAVENLDGGGALQFRCTVFRNEGPALSSDLVREATAATLAYWRRRYRRVARPLTTEVDPERTRRKRDPGRCFRRAGWTVIGTTSKGLVLLRAPDSCDRARVVHCRREPFDVYVGRPGPFGNPFVVGRDGTRSEVVERFRCWIALPAQAALMDRARRELRGMVLGCWCSPLACHGDVLAEVAESEP